MCFFRVAIGRPILRAYRDVIELSGAVPAVIALLFVAAQAHAGEIEPRAYVNTPVGINFLLAGYVYTEAYTPVRGATTTWWGLSGSTAGAMGCNAR
jgi:uncharacterized membrane protein YhhN